MPAAGAHEPSRRIRRQPPLVLAPVPDSVLRTEHPAVALAVQNREVSDRQSERAWGQSAGATLLDQRAIPGLRLGKGIHSHGLTVSGGANRQV